MKEEDQNQKQDQQKSITSSKNHTKKNSVLNKLIFIICYASIAFVGINFISCRFMIPGTITNANVLGGLKNPPPINCQESERRGYEILITLMTTVIALRTKVEED